MIHFLENENHQHPNLLISIPYSRLNCLKTTPFTYSPYMAVLPPSGEPPVSLPFKGQGTEKTAVLSVQCRHTLTRFICLSKATRYPAKTPRSPLYLLVQTLTLSLLVRHVCSMLNGPSVHAVYAGKKIHYLPKLTKNAQSFSFLETL